MKKFILSILVLVLLTGCTSIQNSSLDEIISTQIDKKRSVYNSVNKGYKYYLPRELKTKKLNDYNEIISSKYYDYYLYVDLVSYFNKTNATYTVDEGNYLSKLINTDDLSGIINIKKIEDKYLIKINYNYSSIEVKVLEKDINEAVNYGMIILSSIKFNDNVIESILDTNILTSTEERVDIFEGVTDSNSLTAKDDIYDGDEEKDYDPDVIKEGV